MVDGLLLCWVLEFLLLHRIPDAVVHSLFLAVPLPRFFPLRLKKSILIRRIAAAPVSEKSLHSLELLLHHNLISSLPLARTAYCHAALGSALAPLASGDLPDFFDAVERIWVVRIGDLEASDEAMGLVSEQLLEWKRRMVAAAAEGSKREARDEVLSAWSKAEGVAAVREYLVRELEAMGPPVLEMAAEKVQLGGGKSSIWEDLRECREDGGGGDDAGDCVLIEDVSGDGCVVVEGGETLGGPAGPAGRGISVISSAGNGGGGGCGDSNVAIEEMETLSGLGSEELRTGGVVEQRELGANLRGIGTVMLSVSTPEVNKVKENLKRSREELQNVVEDPLPNAKKAACRVIASKEKEVMQIEETVEKHCLRENESIDSELDNAASPAKKLRLPSPRVAKVSPLKLKEDEKEVRKRRKWSVEEEDALREGVNKYGEGKWAIILRNTPDTFEDRTSVDLKDKWRNMTRD